MFVTALSSSRLVPLLFALYIDSKCGFLNTLRRRRSLYIFLLYFSEMLQHRQFEMYFYQVTVEIANKRVSLQISIF